MSNSLFNEIYEMSISEKLKTEYCIFKKIVEKYKKTDSLDAETEIANDLSELICQVQKTVFEAGVRVAVGVWNEISEE